MPRKHLGYAHPKGLCSSSLHRIRQTNTYGGFTAQDVPLSLLFLYWFSQYDQAFSATSIILFIPPSTASMTIPRNPPASRARTPAIVPPPGGQTLSFRISGKALFQDHLTCSYKRLGRQLNSHLSGKSHLNASISQRLDKHGCIGRSTAAYAGQRIDQ